MTITSIFCDRCSRQIVSEEPTELLVEGGELGERRESIQLCPTCCLALDRWLNQPSPALSRPPSRALAGA